VVEPRNEMFTPRDTTIDVVPLAWDVAPQLPVTERSVPPESRYDVDDRTESHVPRAADAPSLSEYAYALHVTPPTDAWTAAAVGLTAAVVATSRPVARRTRKLCFIAINSP
jgi:hypothetical protein